ncbi:hypothetical protein J2X31_003216 [Flavobacterium arsenatis]|uniref:DUF2971 domain-containing protein n=1 Tax=Flavobacterium arsenatis TaxID=1484332 RepID=A0ABU1TTI3_9FLAO|nr:hypothetical protein [Flavobacterium arsenatis]MDR6969189.1 hypothetical protein [Flavobacterium arsenatis]
MYREHPNFFIDKTKNLPLWRYMEFWKFLDLLESSELHFSVVSKLGDQHEGKIPEKIFKLMIEQDEKKGRKNNFAQNYKDYLEKSLREKVLINSWIASEKESFAMWKMYAQEKLGIAVKTN